MQRINVLSIARINAEDRAKIEAVDPAIQLTDAGGWYDGEIRETWPAFTSARYLAPGALGSGTRAIFVGSPQQIVDKILYERELFGHQRFLAQIDIGGLPFVEVARVIELFAAKVAPVVRGAVAKANSSPDPVGRHFGQPASGP
jgi:alkanesulfonate monooxygenase SsuD/methylene tetrahydromethanopterin reductase-like flavin-dependent oxidoreductase (luciferase family)